MGLGVMGLLRGAAAAALLAAAFWLSAPASAANYEFLGWELNPYIGGSFGRSTAGGDCGSGGAEEGDAAGGSRFRPVTLTVSSPQVLDCEGADTGFKIYGGLRVHEYLALEGGYVSLGEHARRVAASAAISTITAEGVGDVAVTHDGGWAGSFVGMLPIARIVPRTILPAGEVIALGRVGMHTWKVVVADPRLDYNRTDGGESYENFSLPHLREDNGLDFYFGVGGEYLLDNGVGLRLEWERYLFDGDWRKADIDLISLGAVYRF